MKGQGSHRRNSAGVDAVVRTELECYGGGSYDLGERFVTAD